MEFFIFFLFSKIQESYSIYPTFGQNPFLEKEYDQPPVPNQFKFSRRWGFINKNEKTMLLNWI